MKVCFKATRQRRSQDSRFHFQINAQFDVPLMCTRHPEKSCDSWYRYIDNGEVAKLKTGWKLSWYLLLVFVFFLHFNFFFRQARIFKLRTLKSKNSEFNFNLKPKPNSHRYTYTHAINCSNIHNRKSLIHARLKALNSTGTFGDFRKPSWYLINIFESARNLEIKFSGKLNSRSFL